MQIPSFSVTLTMQEWQAVLGALGEMPFSGNAAVASMLTALASYGLITDSSTA